MNLKQKYADMALKRLLPAVDEQFELMTPKARTAFKQRLEQHWPAFFSNLYDLYADRHDFYFHLSQVLVSMAKSWLNFDQPTQKRLLANEVDWQARRPLVGASTYVDRFAGDFVGLGKKIDYLKSLGINYLHLLPFFDVADGDHDGGYAVRDYRQVRADLGTRQQAMKSLRQLQAKGIHVVLDFVFNHTSDQHQWAKRALAGDPEFADFYFFFDEHQKREYEPQLRDIFPDKRAGCFTWNDQLERWIWTTFNSFQWDLNYQNPAVFTAMAEEMMSLVEMGADVIRLDALAFTWKEPGTRCESLAKVHQLIQCFNSYARIVAPGVILKSEAIVHPDEVKQYISLDECQLSYNPMMMALMWEALATGKTGLLTTAAQRRQTIPKGTQWVNYLRCHDDIGWAFDDGDAAALGVNAYDHRQFLNQYYLGRFDGSPAIGLPFGENPQNGDCRVAGTLASLCGVERALFQDDADALSLAQRRVELMNAVMMALPGVPLLYLGDEQLQLNDYGFLQNPDHADDSRWAHRPDLTRLKPQSEAHAKTAEAVIKHWQRMVAIKPQIEAFAGDAQFLSQPNPHTFVVHRQLAGQQLMMMANFSPYELQIEYLPLRQHGFAEQLCDVLSGGQIEAKHFTLYPYQCVWLMDKEQCDFLSPWNQLVAQE